MTIHPLSASAPIQFKGYVIHLTNGIMAHPSLDWHFQHKDFDGADDSDDYRYGYGESVEDCKGQIVDICHIEAIEQMATSMRELGVE